MRFDLLRVWCVAGLCAGAVAGHAQAETLLFVSDLGSGGSVRKYVAETGEFKGQIGTGFVPNSLGMEQSPFDGNLYVSARPTGGSGTIGTVVKLDPYTGAYLGQIGSGFFEAPDDIAFGTDGTMYVSDLRSTGAVILKFNPTTGEYKGLIAGGFLGSGSSSGVSLVAAPNNIIYSTGASGTAIMKFDGLTGQYMGAIGSGFFIGARGLAIATVEGEETLLAGNYTPAGNVLLFRTSDSSYQGMIASGGFAPFVRGIAMHQNGQAHVRAISGTEYVARFRADTGEYRGLYVANQNVSGFGIAMEQAAAITGTITLQDYVGSGVSRPIVMELVNNSGTVLATDTVTITPNGGTPVAYEFRVIPRGTNLRVKARGTRWLKKQSALITVGTGGATGVNLSLINGDVDASGEIDAADIDLVIANFGAVFPGPGPEDSDVDGSTEVDAADIDIVIANFGGTDD